MSDERAPALDFATGEQNVLIAGTGGQGIQVAAKILAHGLTRAGLYIVMFGVFEGEMRGGKSETSLIVSRAPVETGPVVEQYTQALLMSPAAVARVAGSVLPGALVVFNSDIVDPGSLPSGLDAQVVPVPAGSMARSLGNELVASLLGLGALACIAGFGRLPDLLEGVSEVIPSYRSKLIDLDQQALSMGWAWAVENGIVGSASAAGAPS